MAYPSTTPNLDMSEIVRAHRGFVARMLARAGVAERDRPDLEQEVFLVVHRRFHEFAGRSQLRTWIGRIALNVASDHRRRAYQRREAPSERATSEPAPEQICPVERRDALLQLMAAVDSLPESKREVFLRHALEEQPMRVVAEQTGVPLKTAFSRLYQARRELRAWLDARGIVFGLIPGWPPSFRFPSLGAVAASCSLLLTAAEPPAPPIASTQAAPAIARAAEPATELITPSPPVESPPQRAVRHRARPRPARLASVEAPAPPALPAPASLKLVRTSSAELAPPKQLPFGFGLVETSARDRTLALRGPRDAADGVETALR